MSPIPQLGQYQVDHLILLVGGNPLPNAVIGSLLTKPGGKITLIHSKESSDVAGRIVEAWHGKFQTIADASATVNEASRVSIEKAVGDAIKTEPEAHTIGLNLTGGTKAMSTHAFRTLEKFAEKWKRKAVFSYLDARRLELQIDVFDRDRDGHWKLPDNSSVEPIGATSFPLQKMLALHSWKGQRDHPPLASPLLPHSSAAIASISSSKEKSQAWVKWRNDEFRSKAYVASQDKWQDAQISLPPSGDLEDIRQALKADLLTFS